MQRKQKELVEFALRHPNKWHSYAKDKETVDLICATHNLGIIIVNETGQFKLRGSGYAAQQFLGL